MSYGDAASQNIYYDGKFYVGKEQISGYNPYWGWYTAKAFPLSEHFERHLLFFQQVRITNLTIRKLDTMTQAGLTWKVFREPELEEETLPSMDRETLQFPHVLLAFGATLGFLILNVESLYLSSKISNLKRRSKSLAALLLALLAAGLTIVMVLYWGSVNKEFTEIVNSLTPESDEGG